MGSARWHPANSLTPLLVLLLQLRVLPESVEVIDCGGWTALKQGCPGGIKCASSGSDRNGRRGGSRSKFGRDRCELLVFLPYRRRRRHEKAKPLSEPK